MKRITNLSVLLAVFTLVSCGTSKSVTRNKMNLKGKVESVKTSEFKDVGSADMDIEVFNDAVGSLNNSMKMFSDCGINWTYLDAYFGQTCKKVFDKNGYVTDEQLYENNDTIVTARTLDKKGNIILETVTDKLQNTVITINSWEKGLLVASEKDDYSALEDKLYATEYKYEYDGRDLIKTIKNYGKNENVTEYCVNKDGIIVCKMQYDNGNLTSVLVNTVESGKVIRNKYVALDGSKQYTKDYKYLDNKLVEYNYQGKSVEKKENSVTTNTDDFKYKYEYDGNNLIGISSNERTMGTVEYSEQYKNERLRIDFEYEKFKKAFEKELAKQDEKQEIKQDKKIEEKPIEKKSDAKEEKLRNDFEYEKFKKLFDKEMGKINAEENKTSDKPVKFPKPKSIIPSVTRATYSYNEFNDLATMTFYDEWYEVEYVYNIDYEYDKHNNWTKMTISWEDKPLFVKERVITYY